MTELNDSLTRIKKRIEDNAEKASLQHIKNQCHRENVWQKLPETQKHFNQKTKEKFVDGENGSKHAAVQIEVDGLKFKRGIFS